MRRSLTKEPATNSSRVARAAARRPCGRGEVLVELSQQAVEPGIVQSSGVQRAPPRLAGRREPPAGRREPPRALDSQATRRGFRLSIAQRDDGAGGHPSPDVLVLMSPARAPVTGAEARSARRSGGGTFQQRRCQENPSPARPRTFQHRAAPVRVALRLCHRQDPIRGLVLAAGPTRPPFPVP